MKKLLPAMILAPLGLILGLAGGQIMRPPEPEPEAAEAGAETGAEIGDGVEQEAEAVNPAEAPPPDIANVEYVKLDRQFVVPVISGERVDSLIVLSMAIETPPGGADAVFAQEPKLRDDFLRVLFIHAQSGGFSGAFTEPNVLDDLRAALYVSARGILGDGARGVLLTNIVRKDL
ncbi:MAG: flagellar basal body-associated protein FliL [Pikeienuella sp.]